MKKQICIILAVVLALALLAGCQSERLKNREAYIVVAKVEDKVLTLEQFNVQYRNMLDYYGMSDSEEGSETYINMIRESLMENFISDLIEQVQGRLQGLDKFTDEEMTAIEKELDEALDSWRESIKEQLKAAKPGLSEEELAEESESTLKLRMDYYGYTRESLLEDLKKSKVSDRLYDKMTEGVTVTEEDIVEQYNMNVENEKANPSYFETEEPGALVYYTPANARRIKHILIGFTQEQQAEINELRSSGDDEGADKKRAEYLAGIEEEAKAVLASITPDGSNFSWVMKEKSDDPGLEDYPDGYYIVKGGDTYYKEFYDAVYSLTEVGQMTGLVATDVGYHIIRYEESLTEGATPMEKFREELESTLLASKKSEKYSAIIKEWRANMNIVTYMDRIENVY